jgi:excisionase family DNA binding protein
MPVECTPEDVAHVDIQLSWLMAEHSVVSRHPLLKFLRKFIEDQYEQSRVRADLIRRVDRAIAACVQEKAKRNVAVQEVDLLTYAQVCEMLHLTNGAIRSLVHEQSIPHIRLGPRTVRFSRAAVLKWLDEKTVDQKKESLRK